MVIAKRSRPATALHEVKYGSTRVETAKGSKHKVVNVQRSNGSKKRDSKSSKANLNKQNLPRQLFSKRRAVLLYIGDTLYECLCALLRIYLVTCKLAVYT